MCCLQALHEAIPPANLPPELGGSLQQADPLEWLQQQIEQQAEEQRAAEEGRAKHAADVDSLRSFVIADEEDASMELGGAEEASNDGCSVAGAADGDGENL